MDVSGVMNPLPCDFEIFVPKDKNVYGDFYRLFAIEYDPVNSDGEASLIAETKLKCEVLRALLCDRFSVAKTSGFPGSLAFSPNPPSVPLIEIAADLAQNSGLIEACLHFQLGIDKEKSRNYVVKIDFESQFEVLLLNGMRIIAFSYDESLTVSRLLSLLSLVF